MSHGLVESVYAVHVYAKDGGFNAQSILPHTGNKCAVDIENCEGWWSSSCRGSVAEHWQLKPEMSWVRQRTATDFFTFLYFHLITSKFIYGGSNLEYGIEIPG